jgi:hypothetical protein
MSTNHTQPRAHEAKKEMAETPNRDDVHEQREPDQEKEGVVSVPESTKKRGDRTPA